ncbi:hypothetical protein [Anaerotignum sp.]|uniref:hypothetical protein n=1 Tax=Anaerotignum sp. TaxID=2039241 RepID=UPI002715581D|nr:hypothetical protein [Anaerotignum sp.]
MFTFFNSLTVYVAHSLEEQGKMREFLEEAGIEHSVSAVDANSPGGLSPVISPDRLLIQPIDFNFYVYKKDFDRAKSLIQDNWHWNENT